MTDSRHDPSILHECLFVYELKSERLHLKQVAMELDLPQYSAIFAHEIEHRMDAANGTTFKTSTTG